MKPTIDTMGRAFLPAWGRTSLAKRIASGLVLAPLMLTAVMVGEAAFAVAMLVVAALAVREWLVMMWGRPAEGQILVTLALVQTGLLVGLLHHWLVAIALIIMAAALTARQHRDRGRSGLVAFGIIYIAGGLAALLALRTESLLQPVILARSAQLVQNDSIGLAWIDPTVLVAWLFLVVWSCDSFAYLFGRWLGGARLAPRISPNKTWSGSIGGAVGATLIGTGLGIWFGNVTWLGAMLVGMCACMLACISQFGDLAMSRVKRFVGVKESSYLIPGHGGVLDRIDSLLSASWAMWGTMFVTRAVL